MATIPLWMIGKHVTACTAKLCTVDSSGVLTAGTGLDAADLVSTGVIDEFELNASRTTENIAAITQVTAHHVRIARRDSVSISEIMRTGQNACLLANLWYSSTSGASDIVQFIFTRGGSTWTFYGVMLSYSESVVRGKNVARMTLGPVDIGALNADGPGA